MEAAVKLTLPLPLVDKPVDEVASRESRLFSACAIEDCCDACCCDCALDAPLDRLRTGMAIAAVAAVAGT